MNTFRPTIVAAAVVASVAAGTMGLMTFRGETREADANTLCSSAAWPLIPAECLQGAENRQVRLVGDLATRLAANEPSPSMQARFDIAFQ